MKHRSLFLTIFLSIFWTVGVTQTASLDSTQLLKQQERIGKVSGELARDRQKLADLEKELAQKTEAKQKAVERAETSANETRDAAEALSNDAANAAKARQAEKRAGRARREAKAIQRADKNMERLRKDIAKTKTQISNAEKELADLQQQSAAPMNTMDTIRVGTTDSMRTDTLPVDSSSVR